MVSDPDLREHFSIKLSLVARLWRADVDARLAPLGLTQARWYILLRLQTLPVGVTQKDLAEAVGIQGPTLVRTLDSLEQEGLIRRCPVTGDRRAKTVRLTDKATPLLEQIRTVADSVRAAILADVPRGDVETCVRVFDVMIERLSVSLGRPIPQSARTEEQPQ